MAALDLLHVRLRLATVRRRLGAPLFDDHHHFAGWSGGTSHPEQALASLQNGRSVIVEAQSVRLLNGADITIYDHTVMRPIAQLPDRRITVTLSRLTDKKPYLTLTVTPAEILHEIGKPDHHYLGSVPQWNLTAAKGSPRATLIAQHRGATQQFTTIMDRTVATDPHKAEQQRLDFAETHAERRRIAQALISATRTFQPSTAPHLDTQPLPASATPPPSVAKVSKIPANTVYTTYNRYGRRDQYTEKDVQQYLQLITAWHAYQSGTSPKKTYPLSKMSNWVRDEAGPLQEMGTIVSRGRTRTFVFQSTQKGIADLPPEVVWRLVAPVFQQDSSAGRIQLITHMSGLFGHQPLIRDRIAATEHGGDATDEAAQRLRASAISRITDIQQALLTLADNHYIRFDAMGHLWRAEQVAPLPPPLPAPTQARALVAALRLRLATLSRVAHDQPRDERGRFQAGSSSHHDQLASAEAAHPQRADGTPIGGHGYAAHREADHLRTSLGKVAAKAAELHGQGHHDQAEQLRSLITWRDAQGVNAIKDRLSALERTAITSADHLDAKSIAELQHLYRLYHERVGRKGLAAATRTRLEDESRRIKSYLGRRSITAAPIQPSGMLTKSDRADLASLVDAAITPTATATRSLQASTTRYEGQVAIHGANGKIIGNVSAGAGKGKVAISGGRKPAGARAGKSMRTPRHRRDRSPDRADRAQPRSAAQVLRPRRTTRVGNEHQGEWPAATDHGAPP